MGALKHQGGKNYRKQLALLGLGEQREEAGNTEEGSSRAEPQASVGASVSEQGPRELALQVLEKLKTGFSCCYRKNCCCRRGFGGMILSGAGSGREERGPSTFSAS